MITQDTYILAPHTPNNYAVLQQAVADYPSIIEERRVKFVYKKNANDIVADDGSLLVPSSIEQFIYMCATVPPDDPTLQQFLSNVQDYTLYNIDNQPFSEYWLS